MTSFEEFANKGIDAGNQMYVQLFCYASAFQSTFPQYTN